YLGFIFYEKSPRNFTGSIPDISKDIKKIGVFVNATTTEVIEKAITYKLEGIQLHGKESKDYCQALKQQLQQEYQNKTIDQIPFIIKVFSVKDSFDFTTLNEYESLVDYFLFDTKGKNAG